jgi:hypothetical protein
VEVAVHGHTRGHTPVSQTNLWGDRYIALGVHYTAWIAVEVYYYTPWTAAAVVDFQHEDRLEENCNF